ncbi:MAG: hypothetical protein K9K67_15490 [Bacteriovoracaceae bacterium]|nr:hypothetical protein [Bacteriovoracaceae bacterium]
MTLIEIYYTLLLLLIFFVSLYSLSKTKKIDLGSYKKYWPEFLLILVGVSIRFFNIETNSLWFDEYHQYKILTSNHDFSLYLKAQHELQLPFYYGIENGLLDIFGYSIKAQRLVSTLSGSLVLVALFFAFKKIFNNRYAVFLALIYIILNPLLIHMSILARPYALGIFILSFWIYSTISKDTSFFFKLIVSAITILTLGYFSFSFYFSYVLWLFFSQNMDDRKNSRPIFLGLISVLPILLFAIYYILTKHTYIFGVFNGFTQWSAVLNQVLKLGFLEASIFTSTLTNGNISVLFIGCILVILFLIYASKNVFIRNSLSEKTKKVEQLFVLLSCQPFVFILMLIFSNNGSRFPTRYFSFTTITFSFFLCALLDIFFFMIIKKFSAAKLKSAYAIISISILGIFLLNAPRIYTFIFKNPQTVKRTNWKEIYKILEENNTNGARVIPLSSVEFNPGFVAKEFYYKGNSNHLFEETMGHYRHPIVKKDADFIRSRIEKGVKGDYIIVSLNSWKNKERPISNNEEIFPDIREVQSQEGNFTVFKFPLKKEAPKLIMNFFKNLYDRSDALHQRKLYLYMCMSFAFHFKEKDLLHEYKQIWIGEYHSLQTNFEKEIYGKYNLD